MSFPSDEAPSWMLFDLSLLSVAQNLESKCRGSVAPRDALGHLKVFLHQSAVV